MPSRACQRSRQEAERGAEAPRRASCADRAPRYSGTWYESPVGLEYFPTPYRYTHIFQIDIRNTFPRTHPRASRLRLRRGVAGAAHPRHSSCRGDCGAHTMLPLPTFLGPRAERTRGSSSRGDIHLSPATVRAWLQDFESAFAIFVKERRTSSTVCGIAGSTLEACGL